MHAGESDRLARLEREMAILRAEFAKLREHVRAPHAAEAPPPPRSSPPPKVPNPGPPSFGAPSPASAPFVDPHPHRARSFEELIGRYGTIAAAPVTVRVAAGVFLNS